MGQGTGEIVNIEDQTLDRDRDFTTAATDAADRDAVTANAGIENKPDGEEADPEVEALVDDIEATRAEMSETVEALGDRLDPGNVAARAGDAVREATIGKIEAKVTDMTTTASDLASTAGQTAQDAGSGIVETIKRNPIPAAMAGIGLGWLWKNRAQTMSWSSDRSAWSDRRYLGSDADPEWRGRAFAQSGNGGTDVGDAVGRKARQASDAVGDAASSAKRTADQALDSVGETAGQAANTVATTATDAVSQAQRALESNPLAFGAIAVAVGAAVGLAIPATNTEKRALGSAGGQLIDKVETAVSEPLDKMQRS